MNWQFSNSAPIYTQLIGQIRAGIVSGALAPGDNGTMQNCELCRENGRGAPACVTGCPNKAIVYEERE